MSSEPDSDRTGFKYWAFLSYSHKDKHWGDWLHKALETYRVPSRLVGKDSRDGKVPPRVFPIFRDREELPVSADLSSNINEALRESRYLIVICSPASAQSRWVGEEIKTYKKLGREDRILALIVEGEPNASDGKPGFSAEDECFSQALRYRWPGDGESLRSEPIAADVREDKDGKLNAKLKLLAGLLGVNYDDLKRREQERRIRRLRIVVAVTLALVSGFGVLSVYAWRQKQAAESALAQTRQTLSQSDYLQALRAIEENRIPDALAQLARSLVLNPGNEAALCRLTTLLTYGGFDIPVLRFKHHEAVLFAQFSPDGKKIVTASRDGTAVVWDAKSGKALTPALKHDQIVWFAQFSPDSARVLTVSDQAARIWNVSDGKPVMEPLKQKLITSAQFSPDGAHVVITTTDHEARIYDANTGTQSMEPLEHAGPVLSAQFSPDGTRIATASADKTARIWDARNGKPLTPPLQHSGEVVSARFSPDGQRLVTAARDWSARIWDAQSGELQIDILDNRDVEFAQFTPDGTRVVTKSADKDVSIWDAQSGKMLTKPLHHEYVIASVELSPDGTKIVTAGGHENTINVWSTQTGRLLFDPFKHESGVLSARFSPDGKQIVSASWDGTARIWNLPTGRALTQPLQHDFEVDAAEFSPDGKRILTRSLNALRIWDAQTSELLAEVKEQTGVFDSARFSTDSKRILGVSGSTARIWDAQDGKPVAKPLTTEETMAFAQFSPDGKRIAAGTKDYVSLENMAQIWDVETRKLLALGLKIVAPLNWASFSEDGKRLVTASGNAARIWDIENGRLLAGPMNHQGQIVWTQFDPANGRIVTISGNDARIWDAQSGGLLLELKLDGPVNPPQFSPDGKWILTASMDHTARLWDAKNGEPIAQPMRHDKPVNSAQFSPGGKWIVTASNDHTARIWDAQSGTPLTGSLKHEGDVSSARFSPDGRQIVTASKDRTARVWDFLPASKSTPEWLPRLAEAVAGQHLDDRGVFEPSDADPSQVLSEIREKLRLAPTDTGWTTWGRWFLADRSTRTISPFSRITIPQYIEKRIDEGTSGSLDEAERLALGDTPIMKRIEQARAALEAKNPHSDPEPNGPPK